MKNRQINELKSLQELRKRAKDIENLRAQKVVDQIQKELNDLEQRKKASWRGDGDFDGIRSNGSDLLWYAWIEESHQKLLIELAKAKGRALMVKRANAKESARLSAVSGIVEIEAKKSKQISIRKKEDTLLQEDMLRKFSQRML